MDIRKIKTLIEMLEESNLKEIEVSQGDESVRISKQSDDIKIAKDNNSQDSTNQIQAKIQLHHKVNINEFKL